MSATPLRKGHTMPVSKPTPTSKATASRARSVAAEAVPRGVSPRAAASRRAAHDTTRAATSASATGAVGATVGMGPDGDTADAGVPSTQAKKVAPQKKAAVARK